MAHFLVPLSFLISGYLFSYLLLRPVADLGLGLVGMFITEHAPDFQGGLSSIYEGSTLTGGSVPLSQVQIPDVGAHYGQLSSLRLGMDVPVYFGDTDKILARGAGHFSGSRLPGFGGVVLVSGHNNTFFRLLEGVRKGDLFTFTTNYGVYAYRVRDVKILRFDDPKAVDLEKGVEELVLYTCYDFNPLSGRKLERFFVYLDKVSGPVVEGVDF